MSEDLSKLTVMIVDNGLFSDIGQRIAPTFKKVYYWSDWIGAFPSSSKLLPGDGFEDIERVKWKWPAIEKSDLIIYPDVYYGDEQKAVEAMGKRVWGARRGEMLELDRVHTKEMLKSLGEPVGGYEVITGIDDLRKYIKENPNVWVKLSCNRGDAETFHAESYDLIEPRIDEIEHRMGAKASIVEFIVEDNIDAITELGYDGYTIDGKWPKRSFFGLERKDKGFIGRVIEWDEFPPVMRHSNEVLSPYFEKHGYRGFYSSELRISNLETAYLIDPCTRAASPPHEIYLEIFDNWPEIFWHGANGEMVDPNPVAKYGCCAMIHSTWGIKNWLPLRLPESVRQWVKLRNHCRIDGVDYFVPQADSELPEIGAVIGIGDTMQEAEDHLRENAEQIKAYDVDIKLDCFDDMKEEIDGAAKLGIEI